MRTDLPSGIVTFLFTDVEGSTRLLHELGPEAYAEALDEHRRLLRETFAGHGGVEVDTQGDAFFYAFPAAEKALQAASEGQEALAAGPIRVRLGLHTGSPLLTKEGYVGHDVHFAARVASAGHGGQVLLSKETASLVDGAALTSLGSHRLKDVGESVTIYQLGDRAFPRLRTIANSNLPTPASAFLGRGKELYEADELLGESRLVTVTGPGGAGKTRFALELAQRARDERFSDYEDGVYSAFLSSLRDPQLVLVTIAASLGVREQPGQSVQEALGSHLEGKRLLLLLDNLEHLLEATPELSQLLQASPGLTLLCTSRARLRLQGERVYELPPLSESESVSLFCERSQTEPDDDTRELCAKLEGLPLAIELAAARISVLTPQQISTRLSQRLDFLKGGPDRDPRQETLRATIEWSYELLSGEEQQLFSRLAVFSGGGTLEAAEEVADADIDSLQSLVDKSLVRFTDGRYWLLETIREFAGERLEASGEGEAMRQRHAGWMLEWSADMEKRGRRDPNQDPLSLRRELANVRVAERQLRTTQRACERLELVAGLARGMFQLGAARESRAWLEDALSAGTTCPPESRAMGFVAASLQATLTGDAEVGARYADDANELVSSLTEPRIIGHVLLARSVADIALGSLESAERLTSEALSYFEEVGDASLVGDQRNNLVHIALLRGNLRLARDTAERALEDARNRADPHLMAILSLNLSLIAIKSDALDDACRYLSDALNLARRYGLEEIMRHSVESTASVAARRGAPELGAALVGATSSNRGVEDEIQQGLLRETECSLRSALGARSFEELSAAGATMSLEDAGEHAARWIEAGLSQRNVTP